MVGVTDVKTLNENKNRSSPENPADLDQDEQIIIRRVKFCFSDFNLSKERFLQNQNKLNDGWVSLETLMKYNRFADITQDATAIVEALKKSKSGLIQIHEDETKIRRSPDFPVPETNGGELIDFDISVYCKGFPKDTPLDVLIDYFDQFDQVINVVKRNYHDEATNTWHFKGSVFVDFRTAQKAAEFLKLDSLKYKGEEIIKMSMKDYVNLKGMERLERRAKCTNEKKVPKGNTKDDPIEK